MSPRGEVAPSEARERPLPDPASQVQTEPTPPKAPTINGQVHYQVLARWAHGGMADIYVARQVGKMGFDKLVALKVLRGDLLHDRELREMFVQEAKTAVLLNHPRIVQTYDAEETGDDLYLVMEFVQGESLRHIAAALIADAEELSPAFALEVVHQVGLALDYAHRLTDLAGNPLHLVHRDVAPSNVMLTDQGGVKLLDFGIAKVTAAGAAATDAGIVKGKFAYMPPEQLKGGDLDGRTDIYALGLICWELLTGKRALRGDRDIDVIRAALDPHIPAPSEAGGPENEEIDALVLKAIAPDRDERYATAREMAELAAKLRAKYYPDFNFSEEVRGLMERYCADRRERLDRLLKSYDAAADQEEFSPLDLQSQASVAFDPPLMPAPETSRVGEIPHLAPPSSGPPPLPPRRTPTVPPLPPGTVPPPSRPPRAEAGPVVVPPMPPLPAEARVREDASPRRGRVWMAVAAALVLGAVGYFAWPGGETTTVVVSSRPPGATVSAGAEVLGTTPLEVRVEEGQRLPVTLSKRGYHNAAHVVTQNETSGVEIVLPRSNETTSVLVRTSPPGARVRVDGSLRNGTTPLLVDDLWVGEAHRISVSRDGYEPASRQVDQAEPGEVTMEFELRPSAVAARPDTHPHLAATPVAEHRAPLERANRSDHHSRSEREVSPARSATPERSADMTEPARSGRSSSQQTRRTRNSTSAPSAEATTPAETTPAAGSAMTERPATPPPTAEAPSPPEPAREAAPTQPADPPARPSRSGIQVGSPRVAGMIDRDGVRRVLSRARPRLEACLEGEPRTRARSLSLRFAVRGDGSPSVAALSGGAVATNGCVNRVIHGLTFPRAQIAEAVVRVGIQLSPN